MIDHHTEYRHGLAADQRLRHSPPTSSTNGWCFVPDEPRPRVVPMALNLLAVCGIFGAGLIAWCVL